MCSVAQVSLHSANGSAGQNCSRVFSSTGGGTLSIYELRSAAVDELDKRTAHPVEHIACVVPSVAKCFFHARFRSAQNAAVFIGVLLGIAFRLHVAHARAGEHSLGPGDVA